MKSTETDKLTAQEACDYAVSKIVEQGGRSMCEDGTVCAYKAQDGKRCAVGWLIEDLDTAIHEGVSIANIVWDDYTDSLDGIPEIIEDNVNAFTLLQQFHDAKTTVVRERILEFLSEHIDTSAPQYKAWVDMGDASDDKL